jgi:hypothetical protein
MVVLHAGFTPAIEVHEPEVVEEICQFRARVWMESAGAADDAFGPAGWRDPIDSHCRHWMIRAAGGLLVAAGRLSIHETLQGVHQREEYLRYGVACNGPVAAPDRVVVCPSAQGCGLGREILDVQDHAAREMGALRAVRQASPGMVRLLRHRGWKILGPASPDARFPGVEFQVAVKSFIESRWDAPRRAAGARDHRM